MSERDHAGVHTYAFKNKQKTVCDTLESLKKYYVHLPLQKEIIQNVAAWY